MKTLLFALLIHSMTLPPRTAIENPAAHVEIPKQLKKDYDKAWARFVSGKEDSNVLRDTNKLLKKQKNFAPAMVVEAYVDLYSERTDDAERRFKDVLDQNPSDRIALYYLAELNFSRDDFRAASDYYGRLLELDAARTDLTAKHEKAVGLAVEKLLRDAAAAESENRLNDAENLYSDVIRLAPQQPVLQGHLGMLLLMEKKWADALEAFRRQNAIGEQSEDIQRGMAEALMNLGRTEEAQQLLAKLRKPESRNDEFEQRAAELEDLGRWGADIDVFRKIKSAEAITREQAAALIVRYFPQVTEFRQASVVVGDIQNSPLWRDIQTVMGLGLFDLTPTRAFRPAETVTRGEFAVAVARVSRMLGANLKQASPIPTPDLPSSHMMYRDVQLVLQSELMPLDNAGQFSVSATVSGKQSVNTVERLLTSIREKGQ
jgi:tetratricopeptide (TPR) repeat protein